MKTYTSKALVLVGAICATVWTGMARAEQFNIPAGDLQGALTTYMRQTGVQLVVSEDAVKNARTRGVKGDLSVEAALDHLLKGTGFMERRDRSGIAGIVRDPSATVEDLPMNMAAAPTPSVSSAALETVTVTSSKIGGDVQNIPISITALSQEQLTATQTNGGPDLIKQVPNMTFTKTNFSGYSIQIRGIGTQAISVTTDPAVAVAFNDIPFIRNHFFEQEFYDVSSVQVLRGPQGTLYGRNATAGVVNLESAKPTDQFEAMASLEVGNYGERRPEGMINIPILDDRADIRIAGEWTKRQGYSFNEITNDRIDGRDLWSGRVTFGFKPFEDLQTYLIWEHFSENDDRIRSAKQLCKTDQGPSEVLGVPFATGPGVVNTQAWGNYLTQGCKPASFYSPEAFGAPLGYALPYVTPVQTLGGLVNPVNPYASTFQSQNLRVIESTLDPLYKAKNDVVEFNADYIVSPVLTFTSQTGFSHDFLYSAEDYNRFGSTPGFINGALNAVSPYLGIAADGTWCDPQLGCSNRLVAEDLSEEHAWQLSQEFRLTSNFSGPLNFSAGGNYLHYETEEKYYVFVNTITLLSSKADATHPWVPGVSDNAFALESGFQLNDPTKGAVAGINGGVASYIDPNPISNLNDNGHNYFLSKNPYVLNSYAMFGEVNYNILSDLKLITGVRWTEDQKHFVLIPSWFAAAGWGYPVAGMINQQWDQFTGRAVVNWTPKLDFTDQTLLYASYAHGYKAGGANPPGAIFFAQGTQPTHPLTFKPEFVDAFELGTKNTLLDGSLTLNGDLFYYNYENYQISQIVDRTAINLNYDAHAEGAELEATYEPLPGLRFNFAGGWEDTALAKGQSAVDLMDRTAGHAGWYVKKPFVTEASNCIFPDYVIVAREGAGPSIGSNTRSYCSIAYIDHLDPVTGLPYVLNPPNVTTDLGTFYPGFDPLSVDPNAPANVNNGLGLPPNNGTGFSKNLGGNKLPNAPPYTVSFGAQYSMPLSPDWAGTLRSDFYWQDASWWRVFNDLSYDRLHGYANLNVTLILTNQAGWQVMLFDKNVFNTTAITGAFLNSDDSGLTTNVFLTDPKLIGIRVTKNW